MKKNVPDDKRIQTILDLICALDGRIMKVERDGDLLIVYANIQSYEETDEDEQLDEDYQVMILKMVPDENGEEMLLSLDSEEEFNEVWAAFEDRLSDDYEIVN